MNQSKNSVSTVMKDLRAHSGLSQREVATKLGYNTSQFISNWERGLSNPPLEVLPKLAFIFSIPVYDLKSKVLKGMTEAYERELREKLKL